MMICLVTALLKRLAYDEKQEAILFKTRIEIDIKQLEKIRADEIFNICFSNEYPGEFRNRLSYFLFASRFEQYYFNFF